VRERNTIRVKKVCAVCADHDDDDEVLAGLYAACTERRVCGVVGPSPGRLRRNAAALLRTIGWIESCMHNVLDESFLQ
jgi:hypothetical protein